MVSQQPREAELASLRAHIAALRGLLELSSALFASDDEEGIVALAARRAPELSDCDAKGAFLVRDHTLVPHPAVDGGVDVQAIAAELDQLRGTDSPVNLPGFPWARALALRGVEGLHGYLILAGEVEPDVDESLVISGLATLTGAAVSMAAMHRALEELRRSDRRALVDDLLAGTDDAAAWLRGELLGHDMRRPHRVALVRWRGASSAAVMQALDQAVHDLGGDALLSRRDDTVVMVVDTGNGWHEMAPWQALHRRLGEALQAGGGAIGVGGVAADPSDVPRSHYQAAQALSIRMQSGRPSGVSSFDDLGFYRIVARSESRRDVDDFVREWLGDLIDYDAAHDGDLVGTVIAYCESGGNYDRTAQALAIHRSTLRYRLRRIREVSGHDLNDVDTRFNLHVASRAWRVLRHAN